MESPMFSCETSTVIRSGKSPGRHSIASARKLCSSNPPKVLTRTAVPPTFVRGSAFSLTCFAIFFVLDVEQRRHRLVVMYPFDAFPEKLGDAQHRNLKAIHRVDRRAVGGY